MTKINNDLAKELIESIKTINLERSKPRITYPSSGGKTVIYAIDKKENHYIIDIRQANIPTKHTKQIRVYKTNILVRLDFGHYHTNPIDRGGKQFRGPHIHIYDEEYDDRIAYDISEFINITEHASKSEILNKFIEYINLKGINIITDLLDENLPG